MDIGRGIEGLFKNLIAMALIGIISTLGLGIYTIVDFFSDDVYTTKELIIPNIEIVTTDGVSDTTYTYTFKD